MKLFRPFSLLFFFSTLFFVANAGNNNDKKENQYAQKKHAKEGSRVPIDGGLVFLMVAGIGYGTKKILSKKHQNNVAV